MLNFQHEMNRISLHKNSGGCVYTREYVCGRDTHTHTQKKKDRTNTDIRNSTKMPKNIRSSESRDIRQYIIFLFCSIFGVGVRVCVCENGSDGIHGNRLNLNRARMTKD